MCLQNVEFEQPYGSVDVKPTDANPISSLTNTVHAIADGAVVFVAKPLVKVGYFPVYYLSLKTKRLGFMLSRILLKRFEQSFTHLKLY